MLRCKPNELAVISKTNEHTREFAGRFVTTVKLAVDGDFGMTGIGLGCSLFGAVWIVEFGGGRPPYPNHDAKIPRPFGLWPDAWLRPIRDDGSLFDETMFWAKKVPEHA